MKNFLLSICILFTSFLAFSQTPKDWQMVNGAVYSVAYAPNNPSLILIGSEDGVIRKSVDGGVSWKVSQTGSLNAVTNLKAFSDEKYIGVNTNSDIILTTDAGENWTSVSLKDSLGNKIIALTEIVVLSETEAIVKTVAEKPTALYTNDNGQNWSYKPNQPKSLFQVNDVLIGIAHIPNPPYGFTSSWRMLRSTNKGESYDTLAHPIGLNGVGFNNMYKLGYEHISFVNDKIFYINMNEKTFYKTIDGGLNFTPVTPGTYSIYDMFFISELEGMVSLGNSNFVAYTNDGGATWTNLQSVDNYIGPKPIKHLHSMNGQLFMTDYYNSYTVNTTTVKSTPQNYLNTNYPKIQIGDNNTLWTPIDNYFLTSTNGGATWERTNEIIGLNNGKVPADPFATKGDSVFTISNTRLYLSTDAAKTFTLKETFDEYNPQYTSFRHLGNNDFILVGNGVIKFSTDGGDTWKIKGTGITTPKAYQILSLDAIYMVDNAVNLVFSSDTGKTFVNVNGNLPVNKDDFKNLYFVNKNLGFLYGNRGFLYRTEDGGATWVNLKGAIANQYHDWDAMTAKNEKEIYLLDANGIGGSSERVFYSIDGGNTWTLSPNNLNLRQPSFMIFKDETEGLAAGKYGIYRNNYLKLTSTEITVHNTVLGVHTNSFESKKLSFYPNPCSDILSLQSVESITKIEVYNAGGVLVSIKNSDTNQLMLENYPQGIYFIKVYTSSGTETIKIMKK